MQSRNLTGLNSALATPHLAFGFSHSSFAEGYPPPPQKPHNIRVTGRHIFPLIVLIGLFLICPSACAKAESVTQSSLTSNDLYLVSRAIDGDTIVLSDKTRIRYIGINTPETKHPKKQVQYFGKEASEVNRKLVEGKEVRLEYDVQKTDRYGRTLAYVYLEDGTFVNAWLVEQGYARVSTYPPNVKYQDKFIELERKAREEKKGLWNKN